jgi:phage-related protein
MSKLAPAAVSLVAALRGLGPAWTATRLDVQQTLLEGVAGKVTALGKYALPTLRTGLVGIASQLNIGTKSFLDFAGSASTSKEFGTLFTSISATLHNLLPAIQPVAKALLDLVNVGASFGPGIASGIASFATKVSGALSNAASNGSLAKFFSNALTALHQVMNVLGNLASIVGSVFGPAASAGSILLRVIGQITGQFATLLQTPVGKNALNTIFSSVAATVQALAPAISAVLASLLPAIAKLGPPLVVLGKALAGAITPLAPLLGPIATLIGTVVTALAPLLPLIAQLVAAALGPFVTLLNAIFSALGPVITQLTTALQPIIPVLSAALVQLVAAFIPILPVLAQILIALIPLIPPLAKIIVQLVNLAATTMPAFIAIAKLIPPALRLIVPVVNTVITAISGIITIVSSVIGWFSSLISKIGSLPTAISGLGQSVYNAGSKLMGELFSGIKSVLSSAGKFATNLGKAIVNAIIDALNTGLGLPITLPKVDTHIPGVGTVGGQQLLPAIPHLARGATINPVDGGVLAVLAEGGRSESVVDTGLINRQLEQSNRLLAKNGAGTGTVNHTWNVHGAPGQDVSTLTADLARRYDFLAGP